MLTREQQRIVLRAAHLAAVRALAAATGKTAIAVLFALLARLDEDGDRSAERLVRAVFGAADPALIEAAARETGLE